METLLIYQDITHIVLTISITPNKDNTIGALILTISPTMTIQYFRIKHKIVMMMVIWGTVIWSNAHLTVLTMDLQHV